MLFAILLFGKEFLVLGYWFLVIGSLQVQEVRADVPMGRVRRLVSYQNARGKTEAHECYCSDVYFGGSCSLMTGVARSGFSKAERVGLFG